jgi:hypothetical protein
MLHSDECIAAMIEHTVCTAIEDVVAMESDVKPAYDSNIAQLQ